MDKLKTILQLALYDLLSEMVIMKMLKTILQLALYAIYHPKLEIIW